MNGVRTVIKRKADLIVPQGTDGADFKPLVKCVRKNTTSVIVSTFITT